MELCGLPWGVWTIDVCTLNQFKSFWKSSSHCWSLTVWNVCCQQSWGMGQTPEFFVPWSMCCVCNNCEHFPTALQERKEGGKGGWVEDVFQCSCAGMCHWTTSTFKNSCRCTALDMLEWREMTLNFLWGQKSVWVKKAGRIHWQAKQPSQGLFSQKIWSVEELETLPADKRPRTSHHQLPGGERRGKRKS